MEARQKRRPEEKKKGSVLVQDEDRGIVKVSGAIIKNSACSYHLAFCFQLIVLRPKAAIFNLSRVGRNHRDKPFPNRKRLLMAWGQGDLNVSVLRQRSPQQE